MKEKGKELELTCPELQFSLIEEHKITELKKKKKMVEIGRDLSRLSGHSFWITNQVKFLHGLPYAPMY